MKTVLVTGASRGIGLALVQQFLLTGHDVLAGVRRPDAATDLQALRSPQVSLEVISLDVNSTASVKSAFANVSAKHGSLDLLVNNAGVFPEEGDERFEDLNLDHFLPAFETNVVGVARVCQAFLPLIRKGERPCVINVSSGAGSISDKKDHRYYCYGASKAALNLLTRGLAHELRPEGITVVALSPGWVQTEMGGLEAPLTAEDSARSIAATSAKLRLDQSGQFLDRNGEPNVYCW